MNQQLLAGSALVAGESNALTAGKNYAFWDGATASKQAVEYWLEEIDLDGQSTFHGPVVARAVGGAPPEKSQAQILSQMGSLSIDRYATRRALGAIARASARARASDSDRYRPVGASGCEAGGQERRLVQSLASQTCWRRGLARA